MKTIQIRRLPDAKLAIPFIEFQVDKRGGYFYAHFQTLWVSGDSENEAVTLLRHEVVEAFRFYGDVVALGGAGAISETATARYGALKEILT
jgi:hypothetical protein